MTTSAIARWPGGWSLAPLSGFTAAVEILCLRALYNQSAGDLTSSACQLAIYMIPIGVTLTAYAFRPPNAEASWQERHGHDRFGRPVERAAVPDRAKVDPG